MNETIAQTTLPIRKVSKAAFIRHAVANGLACVGHGVDTNMAYVVANSDDANPDRSPVEKYGAGYKRKLESGDWSYNGMGSGHSVFTDGIHWIVRSEWVDSMDQNRSITIVYI